MEFIKIRISEDFGHLGSELEKTIEDMFRSMSPAFSLADRTWKPPMDMNETPDEIVIVAEVAGVDKDDLEVEISSKVGSLRACSVWARPDANFQQLSRSPPPRAMPTTLASGAE